MTNAAEFHIGNDDVSVRFELFDRGVECVDKPRLLRLAEQRVRTVAAGLKDAHNQDSLASGSSHSPRGAFVART